MQKSHAHMHGAKTASSIRDKKDATVHTKCIFQNPKPNSSII